MSGYGGQQSQPFTPQGGLMAAGYNPQYSRSPVSSGYSPMSRPDSYGMQNMMMPWSPANMAGGLFKAGLPPPPGSLPPPPGVPGGNPYTPSPAPSPTPSPAPSPAPSPSPTPPTSGRPNDFGGIPGNGQWWGSGPGPFPGGSPGLGNSPTNTAPMQPGQNAWGWQSENNYTPLFNPAEKLYIQQMQNYGTGGNGPPAWWNQVDPNNMVQSIGQLSGVKFDPNSPMWKV